MNPKDVTMESVSGALGLRFDNAKHAKLVERRNALREGAKAMVLRGMNVTSNEIRMTCYGNELILHQMANELDAEIEKMMGGKQ